MEKDKIMNKITVVGAGYVGIANSYMLATHNEVTLLDINEEKINRLKSHQNIINEQCLDEMLMEVNINYTTNVEHAYQNANYIFVATDTSYDEQLEQFDLTSINSALKAIDEYASVETIIVIKSTVPIGFTNEIEARYPNRKIVFCPEFLREGSSIYDVMNPDRIIIGSTNRQNCEMIKLLLIKSNPENVNVPIMLTSAAEAECIKLFANSYLAMRVAFVNEIDNYCQTLGFSTKNVLDGIGHDSRIGRHYWNPSFGYGGYCLPKDTKQLRGEYDKNNVPNKLITSIVESNNSRMQFIIEQIKKRISYDKCLVIGIYRLNAKKEITNFRASTSLDICKLLIAEGYKVIVYEPFWDYSIAEIDVVNHFNDFKHKADLIVANRMYEELNGIKEIYCNDVYNEY